MNKRKINLLREFVDFICEECHKNEEEVGTLQPHRIRRKNEGGKYEHRNIKMVCSDCHKKYHSREFSFISG